MGSSVTARGGTAAVVAVVVGWTAASFFSPLLSACGEQGLAGLAATLAAATGSGTEPVLLGAGVDLYGTVWTFDAVAELLSGRREVYDPTLFAPVGWDMGAAQAYAWLDAVLAWPLVRALGVPDFYDAHVFLVLVASQLAVYGWMRALGAPPALALALSVAVMRSPWMVREVYEGRPTQAHLVFPVLFLWGVTRLVRVPGEPGSTPKHETRPGLAIATGLALAASALVYWFAAVAAGVFAAVVWGGETLRNGRRRRALAEGVLVGAVALGSVSAVAWRLVFPVLRGRGETWIPDLGSPATWGVRLGEVFLPVRGQPAHRMDHFLELPAVLHGLGVPWLLLAAPVLALVLPGRRERLPWVGGVVVVATLPLGGLVQVQDRLVVTAAGVVQWLFPPLARCHHPERMAVILLLGGAALLATTWRGLFRDGARRRVAVGVGAVGVLAAALLEPLPRVTGTTTRLSSAPFYRSLAQEWPGGIIHAPLWKSNEEYVYQVFHHQPLLGGPGIRGGSTRPEAHHRYCEERVVLRALERWARGAGLPELDDPVAGLARLRGDGFRTVVVHTEAARGDIEALRPLLGEPVIRRGLLVAWTLEGRAGMGER